MNKPRYPRLTRMALMDLRAWISMMFTTFGIMLTVYGLFFVTDKDLAKGGGANLDLWTGLGMLGFAALFFVWLLLSPPAIGERHAAGTEQLVSDADHVASDASVAAPKKAE